MPKRSFRIALVVVVASFVVLGGVGAFAVMRALRYPTERRHGTGATVQVTIEPERNWREGEPKGFRGIAELLHERHIINRPVWFRLYAMHRGATTKVRIGEYTFTDSMTPKEVLDRLLEGVKDVTATVTIPEGLNMLEVFQLVASQGVGRAADLERVARDPGFLAAQGIAATTVEGYLFPETYKFKVPSEPDAVLAAMIKQHRIVWDRIRREHGAAIEKIHTQLGWTDREILTMASIVEKEAVVDTERPRIAQVFINRLTDPTFGPRKLDTDPTIRYGCTVPLEKSRACQAWDKTDRLHRAQLDDRDNRYNTYQHEGLPPGPICNPGERSLRATIEPDGSSFFFFVARDDKSHVFARSRADHERNVDRYIRGH